MVDNTRIYNTYTPTVSFADREDFTPRRALGRDRFNPYSPLAMQRSRRPLPMSDNSYFIGYGIKVERHDYLINSGLDLEAGNKEQHRGFKVDDTTRSLLRSYISGKL